IRDIDQRQKSEVQTVETQKNFVYCQHYKKLIVEDFSFNENRVNLHYGKCAVIGYCTYNDGVYYLGNIRITSLNRNLQLPDDVKKVILLINLCKSAPPVDTFVEVFGESVLYDTQQVFTDDVSSIPCTTSLDLFRMRSAQEERNNPNLEKFDSIVNQRYWPAIKVHEIIPVESAHEIINCNLRLNLIIDKT
ncbi:hypothetical protein Bhyg_10887, partial [Pseudolycoriella hygida]